MNNDKNSIKNFLIKENKGAELAGNSKTLILLDATGSMASLLDTTKKTLVEMFDQIGEVLKEHAFGGNEFQIKISVYRNYNSSEDEIYQHSCWENTPHNLVSFLNNIVASGGFPGSDNLNEAVEIGLWQANQEKDLSQVILIGDAPANEKNKIEALKKMGHFTSSIYTQTLSYIEETQKLKSKCIPVHSFYVRILAKDNFEEIARETSGHCEELNINSPQGSEKLKYLINRTVA